MSEFSIYQAMHYKQLLSRREMIVERWQRYEISDTEYDEHLAAIHEELNCRFAVSLTKPGRAPKDLPPPVLEPPNDLLFAPPAETTEEYLTDEMEELEDE